jgi:hypothetical protein
MLQNENRRRRRRRHRQANTLYCSYSIIAYNIISLHLHLEITWKL